MSSETLMSRFARAMDSAAFEQLVAGHMAPALAVARRLLGDRALAEDAVQETFLRVVRRRETWLPGKPFAAWFYTILRNCCLDMLRRRRREADAVQSIAQSRPSHVEPREPPEPPRLLDRLPEIERDVLSLRIVHGLSFREIAASLGIREEAAKKRGQRGLRRLREHMADVHQTADPPDPRRIAL